MIIIKLKLSQLKQFQSFILQWASYSDLTLKLYFDSLRFLFFTFFSREPLLKSNYFSANSSHPIRISKNF